MSQVVHTINLSEEQKDALRGVCEEFAQKEADCLVPMGSFTGKTGSVIHFCTAMKKADELFAAMTTKHISKFAVCDSDMSAQYQKIVLELLKARVDVPIFDYAPALMEEKRAQQVK